MLRAADVMNWTGMRAQDAVGAKLGRVAGLVVDRELGAPLWMLIEENAAHFRCVPLEGLVAGGGRVTVPLDRSLIKRSPLVPGDGALTPRNERDLCTAYGIPDVGGADRADWDRRRSTAMADEAADIALHWEPAPRTERRSEPAPLPRRMAGRGLTPALRARISVPWGARFSA